MYMEKKRAILSVSDKSGLADFALGLVAAGYEIVSTGGTFETLRAAGLPVIYVSDVTGFPEILDGRVKTLHPAIHGGILARNTEKHRAQCAREGIALIDLVAVNLYPFSAVAARAGATADEVIENIDIGGPALVRAGAKNYERVTVVVNPALYPEVLAALRAEGAVPLEQRRRLAYAAFAHTAAYDGAIADYLAKVVAGQ
jgi:phosphoribosylaminoimidazolecarboxamide formyltransferase/IMP cyclohydrolase